MNKDQLQTRLKEIAEQHDAQMKIRNDAQLLMSKLEGAFETVRELIDNFVDPVEAKEKESNAPSKTIKN